MKIQNKFLLMTCLCICLLAFIAPLCEGAIGKVRIVVTSANIRLKPGTDSTVIGSAKRGQVFDFLQKTGEWYLITLPPDEKGITVSGYIHQSVVEEVKVEAAEQEQKARQETEEKVGTPERKSVLPPTSPLPAESKESIVQRPARKKFFIRMGGGYASKTYSYANSWSFDLYHETGRMEESYAIDSSGFAFDAGVGFLFLPNVGVEISLTPGAGTTTGTFMSTFPHPFYFDLSREKTWEKNDLKYSALEVNLNFLLNFSLMPRLQVYLSGGGTYFSDVKIDNLKVINWNESSYPYFDLNVQPDYATYTQSCYGFNAGGGIDYFFSDSLGINVNVRYASGEATFDVEGVEIAVQTGGLRATAGIKLAF